MNQELIYADELLSRTDAELEHIVYAPTECMHFGGCEETDDGEIVPVPGPTPVGDGKYECRWCAQPVDVNSRPTGEPNMFARAAAEVLANRRAAREEAVKQIEDAGLGDQLALALS